MRISETFVSVQGEGPSVGRPAVFLRLAYRNLGCSRCDTKHAWVQGDEAPLDELLGRSLSYLGEYRGVRLLVVAGGEPLLRGGS